MQLSAFCFSVNNFSFKVLASLQVLRTELEVVAWQYDKFLTREVNQVRSLAIAKGSGVAAGVWGLQPPYLASNDFIHNRNCADKMHHC